MGEIRSLLEKSEIVFFIAAVLGFIIHIKFEGFKSVVDIILGIVMFVSIRPFFKHKIHLRRDIKYVIISLLLNYVLLSFVYLLLASLFFNQLHEYYIGFVLVAIVPPAIAIIPLSYLSKGDTETADVSLITAYFVSLALIPILISLFFGQTADILILLRIMTMIIILPSIFAYITRNSHSKIFHHSKIIINLCLGMIIFIGLALNNDKLFIKGILPVYIVSFLAVFVTGIIVYIISKKGYSTSESVNFSLYASHKNVGTALAIALLMFAPKVAIPAIIVMLTQFVYFFIFKNFIKQRF